MKKINIDGETYHVGDEVFLYNTKTQKIGYADCDIYTITKITSAGYVYISRGHSIVRIAPNGFGVDYILKERKIVLVTDEVRELARRRTYIRETLQLMKERSSLNYQDAVAIRAILDPPHTQTEAK